MGQAVIKLRLLNLRSLQREAEGGTSYVPTLKSKFDSSSCDHLKELKLSTCRESVVYLLIGQDYADLLGRVINGSSRPVEC